MEDVHSFCKNDRVTIPDTIFHKMIQYCYSFDISNLSKYDIFRGMSLLDIALNEFYEFRETKPISLTIEFVENYLFVVWQTFWTTGFKLDINYQKM